MSSASWRLLIEFLTGEAKKDDETIGEFLTSEKRRKTLLKWAWIVIVILGLVASGIALGISSLSGSLTPGIVAVVLIWSILIGGTALVFLSHRLLTAAFGGLLGISISEANAPGLVERANRAIAELAGQIARTSGPATSPEFIGWMLWLFIIVIALFCLPAFFAE